MILAKHACAVRPIAPSKNGSPDSVQFRALVPTQYRLAPSMMRATAPPCSAQRHAFPYLALPGGQVSRLGWTRMPCPTDPCQVARLGWTRMPCPTEPCQVARLGWTRMPCPTEPCQVARLGWTRMPCPTMPCQVARLLGSTRMPCPTTVPCQVARIGLSFS